LTVPPCDATIGIAGEMDITIGDAHYRLGCDSVVLAPAHVPQSFMKVSPDDLCFYTVHVRPEAS
jgi:mannose-6-phosphate isomerase-like protein (cupin superfamily)